MVSDNYRALRDHLTSLQAKAAFRLLDKREAFVPVSIFSERLSLLESIVKYLRQEGLGFADIARLTNRAPSTISTTYFNAMQRMKLQKQRAVFMPVSAIADRRLSTFESVVMYLRYWLDMGLSEISKTVKRDLKVVCRTHNNALKKIDKADFLEYVDSCENKVLSIIKDNFKDMHEFKSRYILQARKQIPASVFLEDVSPLRAVVSYLKDSMTVSEIAEGLNRTKAIVSASYTAQIKVSDFRYRIPLRKLSDRRFSIMESVIHHLRDIENLSVKDTAKVLNRKPCNISQLHARYLKKKKISS